MKKLLLIMITILLVFSLSSCGSKEKEPIPVESGSGSEEADSESPNEGTDISEMPAEDSMSDLDMSAEDLMSDLDRYQKDNLIFYVPKTLNLHTDENANVPENQFFLTGDHMGMIVGRVGEHDDFISGGVAEEMVANQEFMVRLLGKGETIEDINGRFYYYAITEYDDGNVVDTWTVLPDDHWLYLIDLRCNEEEWDIFHDVFALMIEKMEVQKQ